MASAEQLQAIKEQLREEMRAEMMGSALSAARDPDVIRKKPEIPAFDKQHVDIWIRRMENAYIRAGIRSVREKFAFLENKFAVDMDPVINEYLWSDGTESDWDNFLKYLRKEYGLTRQQKASLFVDGFKRNGLRPSQYARRPYDNADFERLQPSLDYCGPAHKMASGHPLEGHNNPIGD